MIGTGVDGIAKQDLRLSLANLGLGAKLRCVGNCQQKGIRCIELWDSHAGLGVRVYIKALLAPKSPKTENCSRRVL